MKFCLLTLFTCLLLSVGGFAQTYTMTNTTVTTSTGIFYDPGGTGTYTNGANITMTFLPTIAGDGVCLDFTTWDLDYSIFGWSTVTFYDGTSTADPLIMQATGDWNVNPTGTALDFVGPGMVCATGPITVVFDPDDTGNGWEATVSNYTPLASTTGCNISVTASTTSICAGDPVVLTATGSLLNAPLNNDFNASTIGTGWSSTVAARYDNPCEAGLDGTPHLWMGVEPAPRALSSNAMDVSSGGAICFDFDMATQADASPCEGPDEVAEGVYLQYSIDAGTNWTTIHYFFPPFYTDGSQHCSSWQRYNFQIPPAAQTASTLFRWLQDDVSSNSTDHWGIDNVIIGAVSTPTYTWDNGLSSVLSHTVTPAVSTVYNVTLTDGTLSCTSSVSITVNGCASCTLASTTSYTDASCNGVNDGTATVSVSAGETPYSYSWSTGATTASVTGLGQGSVSVTVYDNTTCTDVYNISITEPTLLSVTNTCANTTSIGGSDGSSTSSVSGGTTTYTYLWNTGATTASLTGLVTNTYSVTVTDAQGCSESTSCSVSDPSCAASTGTVAVTGTNLVNSGGTNYNLLNGGTIDFSATGENVAGGLTYGYAVFNCDPGLPLSVGELTDLNTHPCYLGSDYGTTTSDFNNNGGSGTLGGISQAWVLPYTSDVSDAVDNDGDGCYALGDLFELTYQGCAISLSDVVTDASCAGGDGSIILTASGGYSTLTYAWSIAGVTNTQSGMGAGTYTCTVTDAVGCTATSSSTVQGTTPPSVTLNIINASCGEANGQANIVSSSGSTPFTYGWSNGSTNNTATGLPSGTITLTLTDANNCTVTDSGSLISNDLATTLSTTGQILCNGDNTVSASAAASGTTPYSYLWNNGNTTSSVSGYGAGNLSVTVSDGLGCENSETISVTEPPPLSSSGVVTDVTCNASGSDGSVTLTTSGGTATYSYSWSNSTNAQDLTNVTSGTYTVSITDANSCSLALQFNVAEPNHLEVDVTLATTDLCVDDASVNALSSEQGGLWTSNGTVNSTTGSFTPTAEGTYTLIYTIQGYCGDADSTTVVVHPLPEITVITTDENCIGDKDGTAEVTGLDIATLNIAWHDGPATPLFEDLAPGLYDVDVWTTNGCRIEAEAEILAATETCGHIYVANIFSPNGDGQNDELYVRGKVVEELLFVIYDRWGEKVFETTSTTLGWDGNYNGKPMNSGVFVYLVRATVDGEAVQFQGNVTLLR